MWVCVAVLSRTPWCQSRLGQRAARSTGGLMPSFVEHLPGSSSQPSVCSVTGLASKRIRRLTPRVARCYGLGALCRPGPSNISAAVFSYITGLLPALALLPLAASGLGPVTCWVVLDASSSNVGPVVQGYHAAWPPSVCSRSTTRFEASPWKGRYVPHHD